MALVPGELDVEKGTNTSKCPAVALECSKYGSTIKVDKYITNDGFKLNCDFILTGYSLDKNEIRAVSNVLIRAASKVLHDYEANRAMSSFYPKSLFDLSDDEVSF